MFNIYVNQKHAASLFCSVFLFLQELRFNTSLFENYGNKIECEVFLIKQVTNYFQTIQHQRCLYL